MLLLKHSLIKLFKQLHARLVESDRQNSNWKLDMIWLALINPIICLKTAFSITFKNALRILIGQQFETIWQLPFLNIGVTLANLKAEMYLDVTNDRLIICARAHKVVSGSNFKILRQISSKPKEFVDLIDVIIFF